MKSARKGWKLDCNMCTTFDLTTKNSTQRISVRRRNFKYLHVFDHRDQLEPPD